MYRKDGAVTWLTILNVYTAKRRSISLTIKPIILQSRLKLPQPAKIAHSHIELVRQIFKTNFNKAFTDVRLHLGIATPAIRPTTAKRDVIHKTRST